MGFSQLKQNSRSGLTRDFLALHTPHAKEILCLFRDGSLDGPGEGGLCCWA